MKYNIRMKWVNKSESFVTVISKANPIQSEPFDSSQMLRLIGGVQKSICWCQRNETQKQGLKMFEKC